MTALAPNGVAVADYDPHGVGAIVFAAKVHNNGAAEVPFGSHVDGSQLFPAYIWEASQPDTSYIVGPATTALPGTWKCLGYIGPATSSPTSISAATLFMRVS